MAYLIKGKSCFFSCLCHGFKQREGPNNEENLLAFSSFFPKEKATKK